MDAIVSIAALSNFETVVVSLITGVIIAVCAPLILALILGRQHRKDKEQDYVRQDTVAKRLEIATELAQKAAENAASKLNEMKETGEKTHSIVNSERTAAMERELGGLRVQLLQREEIERLNESVITPEWKAITLALRLQIESQDKALIAKHHESDVAEAESLAILTQAAAQRAQTNEIDSMRPIRDIS
jgi:uncharacterized membrane protein YraQ (UPF0718 family)